MRIEQTFRVARPPEAVFDYLADPARIPEWQTSKLDVQPLTPGPPRLGFRVRERTRARRGRPFESVLELTEFDRPHRVRMQVVEGPYPIDGTWSLAPDESGTLVHCVLEAEIPGSVKLLEPLTRAVLAREYARHHDRLRRALEIR